MNATSTMRMKVLAYVSGRRAGGFALSIDEQQLLRFARFVDQSGYRGPLTVQLASRWALASKGHRRLTAARRIEVLRGFARYCQTFDPATEIPPLSLFGPGHRRLTPHIFTDRELCSLVKAAACLNPPGGLRGPTCSTIFGLIASTGLRISEATGLRRIDVDLDQGLLHIQNTKFGKSRLVPLHPTSVKAMQHYVLRRERDPMSRSVDAFFVFDRGRPATTRNVEYAFEQLRQQLGWCSRGDHRYPRIHDIRHAFATHRLERWYRAGIDIDRDILALSTYLGHAKITDTYWYVTATPELLALAARRAEVAGGAP
ncbi:MAG: tyrosine-type recombinase/integrase [Steroidobacteraceae bacterium]